MSKATLVMDMPNRCGECKFIRHYETGAFSRNPHCCCELIWFLKEEDYRVDKTSLDENCPLREVPQKKQIEHVEEDYDGGYSHGFTHGYNACIDEILKGAEENG